MIKMERKKRNLKNIILLTLLLSFTSGFSSCEKDSDNDEKIDDINISGGAGVYVAGNAGHPFNAVIWKNGSAYYASDKDYTEIRSISVKGNDIYAIGHEKGQVVLWKNGIRENLTDNTITAFANSIYISGNDVYVAGWYNRDEQNNIAVLWKNGVKQELTDGTYNAYAKAVYVVGNDVYVVGHDDETQLQGAAVLWKNGVKQKLSTEVSHANSIYVSGDDVYIAGFDMVEMIGVWGYYTYPTLWKNGIPQRLTNGDSEIDDANSVFVHGDDVYVAGKVEERAVVWKNGIVKFLSDSNSNANSVYVLGDDVYVVGSEKNDQNNDVATLWKNGVKQELSTGNMESNAFSVFIVE